MTLFLYSIIRNKWSVQTFTITNLPLNFAGKGVRNVLDGVLPKWYLLFRSNTTLSPLHLDVNWSVFTARRIASAELAMAIPSFRPSICPSVTRRYYVKTTAHSTMQFALSDSKMSLVLSKPKNIPQARPLPPEIWAPTDLPSPDSSESWHVLPCSASTVRDTKRS